MNPQVHSCTRPHSSQLVDCSTPLDFAASQTPTVLWTFNTETNQVERSYEGTLEAVNERAQLMDRAISRMIIGDEKQRVDGLISISADPEAVNQFTFLAAAKAKIPVVGTGGTSLGKAAGDLGCDVVGNSGGSVSTTIETKALSFTASLASFWGLPYDPLVSYPQLHSILAACLPVFVAVVLAKEAWRKALALGISDWWLARQTHATFTGLSDIANALPVVVAVVTASQVGRLGEAGLLSGVLAGMLACGAGGSEEGTGSESTVLAGALTGLLAGWLSRQLLVATAKSLWVPATASSIITAGAAGLSAGLGGRLLIRRPCAWVSDTFRSILLYLEAPVVVGNDAGGGRGGVAGISAFQWALALAVGPGVTYGSQRGLYHVVLLPLILFEMERGDPSFLGAVDYCSLCLVSAGVTVATWLLPLPPDHPGNGGRDPRPLARRGAYTNLVWGDFVEACYPLVQHSVFLTGAAYAASTLSTAVLLQEGGRSSAYMPAPLSLWLASHVEEGEGSAWRASLIAFGLPFSATLLRNGWHRFGGWE